MKLLRASRRPCIVIKFWRQTVRDADPGHDVTKSRRRERSRRFVSSLIRPRGRLDYESIIHEAEYLTIRPRG